MYICMHNCCKIELWCVEPIWVCFGRLGKWKTNVVNWVFIGYKDDLNVYLCV
jgi:hypothetical protein